MSDGGTGISSSLVILVFVLGIWFIMPEHQQERITDQIQYSMKILHQEIGTQTRRLLN